MTKLAVISAGITEPSSTKMLADRLTAAVRSQLADVEVDTVDVRDVAHDLTNNVLTGFASPELQTRIDAIVAADALIVATPIYAGSYSGLFKMLLDIIDKDALRGTLVLLAATGGTPRHSLAIEHALRPLFSYLGALTAPTAVYAATADWGDSDLAERIDRAGVEFGDLISDTPRSTAADPFDNVTPFASLLRH